MSRLVTSAREPVLRYREVAGLPKLAWLATTPTHGGGETIVYHGSALERTPDWIVEGVWDEEFRMGGFHTSQHFFGSGIRLEHGQLHFVPSSTPVDRLLYCRWRGQVVVSNSLPLLLAFTGATIDPAHDYRPDTYAIRHGVGRYPRAFTVVHREIQAFEQVYGDALVVGPGELAFRSHRVAPRIPSFEHYRLLVRAALRRMRANYTSPERRLPMTAFATISSGYDSAASTVLVAELGLAMCFTSRRSSTRVPWLTREWLDDGRPIADLLQLRTRYLDIPPTVLGDDELYFLAPGCAPSMAALHALTQQLERRGAPAVLFTGFQGDEMWDMSPAQRAYQEAGLVRGDTSAVMLSEIRLKTGFVNVAVPSLFSRSVRDVAAISGSAEMAPWRVRGGYDRPIARRILEAAGVSRDLFGLRKKSVVERRTYPVDRTLRRAFFAYLQAQGRCSATFVYLHRAVNQAVSPLIRLWDFLRCRMFGIAPPPLPRSYLWRRFDFSSMLFAWAADALSSRLAVVLRQSGATLEAHPARRRSDLRAGNVPGRATHPVPEPSVTRP